jgi:hypothetical protein
MSFPSLALALLIQHPDPASDNSRAAKEAMAKKRKVAANDILVKPHSRHFLSCQDLN